YAVGRSAPDATAKDRLDYGELLVRAGRYREAPAVLEQVRAPANLAAEAAYQRGRALLLGGNGSAARTALRAVADEYRGDTTGAASALYLLGDLATDDGRDDEALGYFRTLYRSYPSSPRADDARFRAALIYLVYCDDLLAASRFDSLGVEDHRRWDAGRARVPSGVSGCRSRRAHSPGPRPLDRSGPRRGDHSPGVELQPPCGVGRGRARADASDAERRPASRALVRLSALGSGPALRRRREPRAWRRPPRVVDSPIR